MSPLLLPPLLLLSVHLIHRQAHLDLVPPPISDSSRSSSRYRRSLLLCMIRRQSIALRPHTQCTNSDHPSAPMLHTHSRRSSPSRTKRPPLVSFSLLHSAPIPIRFLHLPPWSGE